MSRTPGGPSRTQIALGAVMAVALVGFALGIDDGVPRSTAANAPPASARDEPVEPGVMPAAGYLELRGKRGGANAAYATRMEDLTPEAAPPAQAEPDRSRRAALRQREEFRSFHGAPPVIPHDVEQRSSDGCLSCHAAAVQLGDDRADRVPHPYYTNCQQCHVAASPLLPPAVLAASTFDGKESPFRGDRAWDGAPPTVPHATWMREDCLSCHGIHGKPGLRTSHPERANCLQCHAPSAELDQVRVGAARFLPPLDVRGGTR